MKRVFNKSNIIFSFILNLVFSFIMSLINVNLGVIFMILGLLIFPLLSNILSIIFSKNTYNLVSLFIMALFNILYYYIVSNSIMSNPKFKEISDDFTTEKNDFYIEINQNLLTIPQFIFSFLIYFCLTYLILKIFFKGEHNVKNR